MICVEQVNRLYIEPRLTAYFRRRYMAWRGIRMLVKVLNEKHEKFMQINQKLNSAVRAHVFSGRSIAGKWRQPVAK